MKLSVAQTRSWLNSIHFHALALSLAVIAAMIAISLGVIYVAYRPSPRVSVHEMARLAKGLPLVRDAGPFTIEYQSSLDARSSGRAEVAIGRAVAEELGLPVTDVQVSLADIDQRRSAEFERERQIYGRDDANETVMGPFRVAVREGSGWKVVARTTGSNFGFWKSPGRQVLIGALLLAIPLTYWFSRRLTRSIRSFAKSADDLQAGKRGALVPLAGPTEIRMAASALNEMQGRIERFVQERTALVGAIAHDLRAPLARLEFHLLKAGAGVREAAGHEIREMEALIAMIMEFVEQETKHIELEPLDLAMLVEGISDDFQDRGKPVFVQGLAPAVVRGDHLQLRRLFVNVIDNAVTYGERATISLSNDGNTAVVEIVDKGPGMTVNELERAFEPFFRGEPSRNRRTGGVGLGLSIVKSAADAHGATVNLSNVPGGGLSVRISMASRGDSTGHAPQ